MIKSNPDGRETLKEMKARKAAQEDAKLKEACEKYAIDKYTEDQIIKWSNQYKGLWFMPVLDEAGEIEKLSIMKPIDRHILSLASTKLEDGGLYTFLEECMRECLVNNDEEGLFLLEDEDAFISGAMKFNKIMESRKVGFLKR